MAELKYKVSADTTALAGGLRRAKALVGGFARSAKSIGFGALKAGAVGAAAGLVTLTVAARGLKGALQLGGDMSDVAANTGLLAGEALVLGRAFQDAGVDAENLRVTINTMQKTIVEAGEGAESFIGTFSLLGLEVERLIKMDPGAQFQQIQQSLAGVEDPAVRVTHAMRIFGEEGAKLQALFSDGAALDNAAVSVGEQAEILNRNAVEFDRSADILGGIGEKMRGFFVGMAEGVNKALLPLLEELNKVDLAGYGRAAGELVLAAVEMGKAGRLMEYGAGVVKLKIMEGINAFVGGLRAGGIYFFEAFKGSVTLLADTLMDSRFWDGIGEIAKSFGSELRAGAHALADVINPTDSSKMLFEGEMNLAEQQRKLGNQLIGLAGDSTFADVLGEAFETAVESQDGFELIKTGELRSELAAILQDAQAKVTAMMAGDGGIFGMMREGIDRAIGMNNSLAKQFGSEGAGGVGLRPQVTALQRVGGASIAGASVGMDQERNRLLRSMDAKMGRPVVAVYA